MHIILHLPIIISIGVIFNSLGDDDFDYTIRLRHEVSGNSWNTDRATFAFQLPGPTIENKYVVWQNSIILQCEAI